MGVKGRKWTDWISGICDLTIIGHVCRYSVVKSHRWLRGQHNKRERVRRAKDNKGGLSDLNRNRQADHLARNVAGEGDAKGECSSRTGREDESKWDGKTNVVGIKRTGKRAR